MAAISTCFTISPNCGLYSNSRPSNSPRPPIQFQTPRVSLGISWKVREPRVLSRAGAAKASSVDVASTTIRPGGAVESDKLPSDVRKRAMDAVDACGGRVTIGDVASRAGLKLNEAQKALQALASDTNGFLEVHTHIFVCMWNVKCVCVIVYVNLTLCLFRRKVVYRRINWFHFPVFGCYLGIEPVNYMSKDFHSWKQAPNGKYYLFIYRPQNLHLS